MFRQRISRLTTWLVALALLSAIPTGMSASASPSLRDVQGNTYTSPQFGYTLTWDNSWFVVEEKSEEFDRIILSNGVTIAQLTALKGYAGNQGLALAAFGATMGFDASISDFRPLTDDSGNVIRGSDDIRTYAAFTYTYTYDDGSKIDFEEYIEVRTLVPDQAVLIYDGFMPAGNYASQSPAIQALAAGISIPNQGSSSASTSTEPELALGEPAPVFASSPWRVAVVTAALSDALPEVGLKAKSGKEWLVVVADVTNWSSEDADFAAKDFTIRYAGTERPGKLAAASTRSVAKALEIQPTASDVTTTIAAEQTTRVALVFQLPAGSDEPALVRNDASLPLNDALQFGIDPNELSPRAGPPKVRTAEVTDVVDGQTLKLTFEGKTNAQRIELAGVSALPESDCNSADAIAALEDLKGTTVYVETDEAIVSGSVPTRYVWVETDDGTRTLLNQEVIATGMATAAELPTDARFGTWLSDSERIANEAQVGVWAGCAVPNATPGASNS